VLDAVWSFADVDGCYDRSDVEPEDQPRRAPVEPGRDIAAMLRGRARLASGVVVPASTIPVREEGGNDWLYFGLPTGSIGRAYPVGAFPFDDGTSLDWRDELDAWLRALAMHVFAKQPFQMALIGFVDAEQAPERALRDGVPERRWVGNIVPDAGVLRWFPPTEGAPIQ
jgi:hypothetical protein